MSRRASLPGAAELFRNTGERAEDGWQVAHAAPTVSSLSAVPPSVPPVSPPVASGPQPASSQRRGSPRQKHTSKITVYVSDEELLALEHARLALRATHGLVVDRGRVVREAIAVVLADLDERGEDSVLVRRLRHDTGK